MTGAGIAGTFSTPKAPRGKYDDPSMIQQNINQKGLRGVRFYDASDPAKLVPLSQWSCDQGDPKREVQTGSGTHRSYYDGGQYAYLDTAPDNSFTRMESSVRYYCNCVQIIDVSDPAQPEVRRQLVGAGPARGRGRSLQEMARIRRQGVVDDAARPDVRAEQGRRRRQDTATARRARSA